MIPTETILLAAAPLLGGWIWRTEQRLSKLDGVIEKMDQLVSLLLEDRLDKSQERGNSQNSSDRSSRRER